MKTLIITEKPKVSLRIAQCIAPKFTRKRGDGVSYYEGKADSRDVVIASAAGHLYSITQTAPDKSYPVFDVTWAPISEIDESKSYVKKYLNVLSQLANDVDEFYIATDYDIEGELLGYNALMFACKPKDEQKIKRMKFSALTHNELKNSFENPVEVDRKLVEAGETRHMLDWFWGINTSRALTHSLKNALGQYAIISAGRVQTPALSILARREREIKSFTPQKYWEVYAELDINGGKFEAKHEKGAVFERSEVDKILENSRSDRGTVLEFSRNEVVKLAPPPFDLGTLQAEAYRILRLTPKKTQDTAQKLYESGCISYPRTSSQKLPYGISYERILKELSKIPKIGKCADVVLQKPELKPRQGGKTDPAHPAIYPTGILPKKLGDVEQKLYDLIAHRFIAVFGDPMVREVTSVKCEIGKEKFSFGGEVMVKEGWLPLYPYLKFKEIAVPQMAVGDAVAVAKVRDVEKETKPPDRFNPASLVRELDARGLGTKATRAEIVDTLYRREYISGSPIEVNELGLSIVDALEAYAPEIISEKLTRTFEDKIENIRSGKETKESTLQEAKETLHRIASEFKANEKLIGEKLGNALAQKNNKYIIGKCPNCGSNLRIIKSRKTSKVFVGCTGYPKCTTSYPLPQKYGVKTTDKKCYHCGLPMVSVPIGKRRILSCIDMNCASKKK